MRKNISCMALALTLGGLCLVTGVHGGQSRPGRVYLVLWFDTEDYVLPQTNDVVKRLATFLTQQGIRASFRVVGEKARMLEREGRRDVIEALDRHEIGFHSNVHSQKPLIDEYEEPLNWEAGVEEFNRRERPGFADVRRIFGQFPTNYCQPGATWAPQAYGALDQWGVKVYLCSGRDIGLDGKPFWYGRLLNIYDVPETSALRPNIDNSPESVNKPDTDWTNLDQVKANFQEIYSRMSSQPEGGVVSFMFHPYEFITKVDWDIINFAHGDNPPRSQWKLPPLRNPEVSARAFHFFEKFITYTKSFPNVEYVTPSQVLMLFADAAQQHSFPSQEISRIAAGVGPDVSFQVYDDYGLAPSEVLAVLNKSAMQSLGGRGSDPVMLDGTPYGPDAHAVALDHPVEIRWSQFSRTMHDVEGFLEGNRRVPNVVWFGSQGIPPESYLVALAAVVKALQAGGSPADPVVVGSARLATTKYAVQDSSAWQWIIAPDHVQRPNLIEIAKLQTWTLKPAKLRGSR